MLMTFEVVFLVLLNGGAGHAAALLAQESH